MFRVLCSKVMAFPCQEPGITLLIDSVSQNGQFLIISFLRYVFGKQCPIQTFKICVTVPLQIAFHPRQYLLEESEFYFFLPLRSQMQAFTKSCWSFFLKSFGIYSYSFSPCLHPFTLRDSIAQYSRGILVSVKHTHKPIENTYFSQNKLGFLLDLESRKGLHHIQAIGHL